MTLKKAVEAIESNPSLKKQFISNCIAEMGEYTYKEQIVWNDYDIDNIAIFQKNEIDFSEDYFQEALEKVLQSPNRAKNSYNVSKICRDVFDGFTRVENAKRNNCNQYYVRNVSKEFKKHLREILDRAT